jgi:internalin A
MTTEFKRADQIALKRIKEAKETGAQLLDLTGLGLTKLPKELGELESLRTLQLCYNHFEKVPIVVNKLTNLRELDLSANHLQELPTWIGELKKLSALRLSSNQLSGLPDSLASLNRLTRLYVSENNLTVLPDTLFALTELNRLTVAKNGLKDLPSEIQRLTLLTFLDLSENELRQLPKEANRLTRLEQLILNHNKLVDVPPAIQSMHRLTELNLANNRLQQLPEWMKKLDALRRLILHQNPGLRLESSIFGASPREDASSVAQTDPKRILDYYFSSKYSEKAVNEARLVLVGRGAVGKTSLVKQLVKGQFNQGETRTDGIDISRWHPFGQQDDRALNIWDFGGQEIMHATHQFFLTPKCLYLIVLNGRDGTEERDVVYWLELVQSFAGASPVIVIQNKIDDKEYELNYRELKKSFPQIVEFQKTDCATARGIEELKELIRQTIDEKMSFMRERFQEAWFSVKSHLADMGDKYYYISYDVFQEICKDYGIREATEQATLAHKLHCLGVALNFKDDPRLHETSVLNPHWVTDGVYGILTHNELARQHGVLRLDDIGEWLEPVRYPRDKHRFLVELMRKFKLCFAFPGETDRFLVPELLPREHLDFGERFEPARCLNFEYHYEILPEGLIGQFIVLSRVLSDAEPEGRWRNGVVVKWEQAEALVEAETIHRKIVIRVTGDNDEERRRLLATIRTDFKDIHARLPSLKVDEQVPLAEHPEVSISYRELLIHERHNAKQISKAIDDEVVYIGVKALLDRVDFGGGKSRFQHLKDSEPGIRVFISYATQNEPMERRLETHLKALLFTGAISVWSEHHVPAGDDSVAEIDSNLDQADIILLLISGDFIDANFSSTPKMPHPVITRAMERHDSKEARVIPVILKAYHWKPFPFGHLKPLPTGGRPVENWEREDDAWKDVVDGIVTIVEEIRNESVN